MKKHFILFFITISIFISCTKNPFTGKNTLNFVSNSKLFPTSFQQYGTFLKDNKVVVGTTDAKRVETVGLKIKMAAEKYLDANGFKDYLKDYAWEYKLVESKEVNAWCLPGGKIVFYSAILSICKDDAGMATVMGHEVAHALANHGAQRMSAGILQQAGAGVVGIAMDSKINQEKQIWMTAYGGVTQYGAMLPFNRNHESEADKIGLILMAIAGYDPSTAVAFWERMSANSGGKAQPEFLSTHPSDANRIAKLKSLIPKAKIEAAKFGVIFK
jgi:Zn-dependent protease with chaperone function